MEQNHSLLIGRNGGSVGYGPKRTHLLFPLLLYRVRKWCVWVASSNVVSIELRYNLIEQRIWIWILFDPKRFPWNMKDPIGYIVAFILQSQLMVYQMFNVACILSIGFGAYLFIMTLTEDLKMRIAAVNECGKNQASELDALEKVTEFIHLHSDTKQ